MSRPPVILPIVYGGTSLYYAAYLQAAEVRLEQVEHFEKQTWRNRCRILTANGAQDLIVPLRREGRSRTPMKELRIAYDHPWQALHWKALTSAYNCAPYFEFFEDRFRPLFEERYEKLVDLDLAFHQAVLDSFGLSPRHELTERYEKEVAPFVDLRHTLHAIPGEKAKSAGEGDLDVTGPYPQVFDERFGFVPGLSVVDLLFNEGPSALETLRKADPMISEKKMEE